MIQNKLTYLFNKSKQKASNPNTNNFKWKYIGKFKKWQQPYAELHRQSGQGKRQF